MQSSREDRDVDTTPESLSVTSVSVRRSDGLLRQVANRLRTAAHGSRANRAENVTEPTINLVVGDHELYVKRSNSRLNVDNRNKTQTTSMSYTTSAINLNNNNNTQTAGPLVNRQPSNLSTHSNDNVWSDNRYIMSHGKVHFWKNYNYGEVRDFMLSFGKWCAFYGFPFIIQYLCVINRELMSTKIKSFIAKVFVIVSDLEIINENF